MTFLRRHCKLALVLCLHWLLAAAAPAQTGGTLSLPVCQIVQGEFEVFYARNTLVPGRLRIGVSTAYNNKEHNIDSVWHPVPRTPSDGKILNLTNFALGESLPKRFILGDGALTRAFFLIDQQKGTKLDAILDMFVSLLPGMRDGKVVNEDLLLKFLQRSLDMLVNFRWRPGADGKGENAWDPERFVITPAMKETFSSSASLAPGAGFYVTERDFPTVAFERFLESECAAYCIQKSVLVKLILDRVGIPSRLVTGSTINIQGTGFTTAGHTWVEVRRKDQKLWVLDPEQERLEMWGPRNELVSDWFWFNGFNRRENHYYPIMVQVD